MTTRSCTAFCSADRLSTPGAKKVGARNSSFGAAADEALEAAALSRDQGPGGREGEEEEGEEGETKGVRVGGAAGGKKSEKPPPADENELKL